MKKILILFFILLSVLANGQQDVRPVATTPATFLPVPTYSWWYNKPDSTVWVRMLNNSQIPEWMKFTGVNRQWWTQLKTDVAGDTTFTRIHNRDSVSMARYRLIEDTTRLKGTATVYDLLSKINGLGTINYISKFTDSSTIGNSQIIDDGTNVGVGGSGLYKLEAIKDITYANDIVNGDAQFSVGGATTRTKRMTFGYDTYSTNGFGFIKTGNQGAAYTPLYLNPANGAAGGGVSIGYAPSAATPPNAGLLVQGNSAFGFTTPGAYQIKAAGDSYFGTSVAVNTVATQKISIGGTTGVNGMNIINNTTPATVAQFTADMNTGEIIIGGVQAAYYPVIYSNNVATMYFAANKVGINVGPNASAFEVYNSSSAVGNNPGNSQIRATGRTGANVSFTSVGYDPALDIGYIQAAKSGVAWEPLALNANGGPVFVGYLANPGSYLFAVNGTTYAASSSTANSFIKIGGTSAQYLLADGSVTTSSGAVYKDEVDGDDGLPKKGGSALIDGTGTTGWYYACYDAGTYDYGNPNGNSITLAIGDQIYYNGTIWIRIPGASAYTLPIALTTALGGVISNGNVSVNASTGGMTVETNANLSGDVTSSGNVTTIANSAVTLAKMADMATASFIGRNTAATGVPEVISVATAKTMLGLGTGAYATIANYRRNNDHDSLGTLQEKSYNSLTDKPILGTASAQDMAYFQVAGDYVTGTPWTSEGYLTEAITSLGGLTAASQTFGIGTTGTAPNWSSATSTHTLHVPMAGTSGVTAGLISNTQYNVFDGKLATNGSAANLTNFPDNWLVNDADDATSGTLTANYFIGHNFTLTTSDSTLKRNIRPFGISDFSKASKIDFKKYLLKTDTTNRQHYGAMAQEVELVFPEMVYTNLKTGKKTVSYEELLIVKFAAMEEEIRLLKEEIKLLKK